MEAVLRAAFFVPLVEVREQCQDGVEDAENELEPLEFVHDITPSLSRGSRPPRPAIPNTIILSLKVQENFHLTRFKLGDKFFPPSLKFFWEGFT